ncbi:MAG: hypothetical protein JW749_10745 [Sedimentisphaerales bacterium]|nr:hypothetical protein [Sedimentisphaerales bacterium]
MLTIIQKNRKKRTQSNKGLSTIELILASIIGVTALLGVGIALSDSHRGFTQMYKRIYSDVVTDGHVAKRMFDSMVRKSNCYQPVLDADAQGVEVRYYADSNSLEPDQYSYFYYQDGNLYVEYGRILSGGIQETLDNRTACRNVTACTFKQTGRSLQMILTLNNGSQELTTVTSAVMHN